MSKRVVNYDPTTGITTSFEYVESSDTTVIHREQDVSSFLDLNKTLQNDPEVTKEGIKNCWWMYARIPNIVIEKWLNERGVNAYDKNNWGYRGAVWKLLNDPEYRYLKTTAKMHAG